LSYSQRETNSQSASAFIGSENSLRHISNDSRLHFISDQIRLMYVTHCRFGTGSNQLEILSIEYPMPSTRETTPPPTTSKATKEKKAKGKAKAASKKKKKKEVSVPHDSPAMGTRSRTPQKHSPASHTRSKRKLPDLNF
jgi:hypothetical protein